jgi:apolipoprotein N-acyltransferase
MKRWIVPSLLVVIVLVELVLALRGSMAFRPRPSAIVALPYTYGLEQEQVDAVYAHVQRAVARTRVFRVVPHQLIEDYYLEKRDDPAFEFRENMSYREYAELAEELELERIVVITIYPGANRLTTSVTIRRVDTGGVAARASYDTTDVAAFLAGTDRDGEPINLVQDLREETRGVTLFDNLFFVFLAGQLALAVFLVFRRRGGLLNQFLIVAGLLLFLFAFVYAKNASMDYVQRFIANKGQITLAESTGTEQLHAVLRFGPFLLANVALFVSRRVRRRDAGGGPAARRIVADWGLPLVLVSALLYSLAFPSFAALDGIPVLAWVCLVPFFLVVLRSRDLDAIFHTIVFGALSTLILNYWHGTYSYISLAFSVIIGSLMYLVWAPIFVLTTRRLGRWGFLVAPAIWVAFDYVRSLGYIGYPWGYLGASQYSVTPVIQIADLTGIWGVTFLMVLWNAGLAWWLAGEGLPARPNAVAAAPSTIRERLREAVAPLLTERRWLPVAVVAGVMAAAVVYGLVRMTPRVPEDAEEMRVVLVQQNTDPRKHDYRLSFETLKQQTTLAFWDSEPRVSDLVVWPEGGFKPDLRYWLERSGSRTTSASLVSEFMDYTSRLGTYLVTGTQDHVSVEEPDEEGELREVKRNFNSSVLMSANGEIMDIYHKMRLVPFTEHFPYKEEFPWLAELLDKFDTSNWKQGEERTIYEHPIARFFTPICFEDIFPNEVRQFVAADADLIVNISNDYWSLTPVEGKQHGVQAMFRAVENRRPMVRATCSGLTTCITAEGRMAAELPYYQAGYLTVDIPIFERGLSVYTRLGDWLPLVCLAVSGAAMGFVLVRGAIRLRRKRRGDAPGEAATR